MPLNDERTPLLQDQGAGPSNYWDFGTNGSRETDFHRQFCELVGIPYPTDGNHHTHPGPKTLYGRALSLKSSQGYAYQFTAGISNSLLLAQVILGAAVTALGASESSHILITIFGAMNTIIAGVVAYLKSRGQPMRARMYRDDLERVVDEIENSEVMWLGISKHMHGYSDIDIDKEVTVRSEVARLTRLYDRAVRNNTLNNPDMYMASSGFDQTLALRSRPAGPGVPALPPVVPTNPAPTTTAVPAAVPGAAPEAVAAADPDESPATAPPKPPPPPKTDGKEPDGKEPDKKSNPEPAKSADDAKAPAPTPDPAPPPAAASASTPAPAPAKDDLDDEPEPAAEAKPKA